MAEPIKLAEEDIESLRQFRQKYFDIVNQFGQLEVTRVSLDKSKEVLVGELEELATREEEITSEFESKYGIGEVNLETGEFIPQSD